MHSPAALCAFIVLSVLPISSREAVVDSSYIPDGQYVVRVEKVEDAHHVFVMMQNGVETTLVGRANVDFSKLKPNDTIKIALVKGEVPVYAVQ
ncbi:MAG: hypothetical protein JO192_00980 [Candidatus Eremiobacteraeota bacterium]|nr:hypothetical protein [Candidatus Eremiobacteraeota bacterium]MBV8331290.1 hypothetical protein [Candidatus Eremiobacteraeota bacterium]